MKLAIYEHDVRTGEVDLDARSFEYDGESQAVRELLQRMENGELTRLQPTLEGSEGESERLPDEGERDRRPGMIERTLEGKALGRQLRQSVKTISTADVPMRVEALDGSLEADTITLQSDGESENQSKPKSASERGSSHFGPPGTGE